MVDARRWIVTTRRLARSRRLYDFARLLEASPVSSDPQGDTRAILREIKRVLSARRVELILPGAIDGAESVVLSTDNDPVIVTLDDRSRAALAGDLGPVACGLNSHVRSFDDRVMWSPVFDDDFARMIRAVKDKEKELNGSTPSGDPNYIRLL